MSGCVVVVFVVLLALLAAWLAPYDPLATSWCAVRKAPTAAHWFGTDEIGRDVLSRVIWGARASLARRRGLGLDRDRARRAARAAGRLSSAAGSIVISRITDAMLACPFLILAIALAAFLGPSLEQRDDRDRRSRQRRSSCG